jgi:hypothetical protein
MLLKQGTMESQTIEESRKLNDIQYKERPYFKIFMK